MLGQFFQNRMAVLCAFCRTPRHVYKKKRIGMAEGGASFVCGLLLMGLIHQGLDARVFIYFVMLLASSELFIQLRWRMALRCPHCGFDPVVYAKKPEEAARLVRIHLEGRKNNADMLLARPLQLPKRRNDGSKGKNLSKRL